MGIATLTMGRERGRGFCSGIVIYTTEGVESQPGVCYSLTALHNPGNKICFHLSLKKSFKFCFLLQVTKKQVLKPSDSPERKQHYNFRLAWYFPILPYSPHFP